MTELRHFATAMLMLAGTSTAALAQSATGSRAEPQAADQEHGLQDIMVTARRKEENLQDVPVAVSAFTPETLARAGVTKAEDLVRVTPGLQFSRFVGVPVATSFGIRGQRTKEVRLHTDPAVITYVAEVPQHLPFGTALTGFLDVKSVAARRVHCSAATRPVARSSLPPTRRLTNWGAALS